MTTTSLTASAGEVPGRDWLPQHDPEAACALERLWDSGELGDVDRARLTRAVQQAGQYPHLRDELCHEIITLGPAAAVHSSGQRDLPPNPPRVAEHDLHHGQVLLGRVCAHPSTPPQRHDVDFGMDLDCLRANLLVIGPPDSGKTRSLALPLVEHLCLESLANAASVVVIDPQGDDFDIPGWFDVTIDSLNPDVGFSLFGAATNAEEAADQLASALLPIGVSADHEYLMDASRNALYNALASFQAGMGRWPTVRELLGMLRNAQEIVDRVRAGLNRCGKAIKEEYAPLLAHRAEQLHRREDPAASLIERLSQLDRPRLRSLFDHPTGVFAMTEINRPLRIRIALREAQMPEASRFLARLVVSQFTHVVCNDHANRDLFKGLVVNEAGRFVDDCTARALQRTRSDNAGLILLSQSLEDFPPQVWPTVFASTGGKAVFGGVGPADAEHFSRFWGEQQVLEHSYTHSTTRLHVGPTGTSQGPTYGATRSSVTRKIWRERWPAGDLSMAIPPGHTVIQLRHSTGQVTLPELVRLR